MRHWRTWSSFARAASIGAGGCALLAWLLASPDVRVVLTLAPVAALLWTRPVTFGIEGSFGGAAVVTMAILSDATPVVVATAVAAVVVGWTERRLGRAAAGRVLLRLGQAAASVAVVAVAGAPAGAGVGVASVAAVASAAHLVALRRPTRAWLPFLAVNTALVVLAVATWQQTPVVFAALAVLTAAVITTATAAKDAERSRIALGTVVELMPFATGPDPVLNVEQSLAGTARQLLGCDDAAVSDAPALHAEAISASLEIDGERRWLVVNGAARRFTDEDRRLLETIAATGAGLLAAARRTAAVAHAAEHDTLTGAPNRRALMERLRDAAASGQMYAVAFVDLDGFKQVNDQFGHAVGDEVLVHTYDRLRSAVRATDTVARLGGDEFCVLFGPLATADECTRHAERLMSALAPPWRCSVGEVAITASIGISVSAGDIDVTLELADAAMYDAKSAGKNAWRMAAA